MFPQLMGWVTQLPPLHTNSHTTWNIWIHLTGLESQNALMSQLQCMFLQSRKIPKIYSTDVCMQEYICSFVPLRLDLAGSFVCLDLTEGSVWGGPRKTEYAILMFFFHWLWLGAGDNTHPVHALPGGLVYTSPVCAFLRGLVYTYPVWAPFRGLMYTYPVWEPFRSLVYTYPVCILLRGLVWVCECLVLVFVWQKTAHWPPAGWGCYWQGLGGTAAYWLQAGQESQVSWFLLSLYYRLMGKRLRYGNYSSGGTS